MAVLSASDIKNVWRSLAIYSRAKLSLQGGYTLDRIDTGQDFDDSGKPDWIQVRLIMGGTIFRRQTGIQDAGAVGQTRVGILNFNLFQRWPPKQAGDFLLLDNRQDWVFQMFSESVMIPIRDYDTVGNPIEGHVRTLAEVSTEVIQEGESTGLRQVNIGVPLVWLEEWS